MSASLFLSVYTKKKHLMCNYTKRKMKLYGMRTVMSRLLFIHSMSEDDLTYHVQINLPICRIITQQFSSTDLPSNKSKVTSLEDPGQVYMHFFPQGADQEEAFLRMVRYSPIKPRTVIKQTNIMTFSMPKYRARNRNKIPTRTCSSIALLASR